ncbi:BQ5605_C032g11048 [Microbotryum silenes-dioicae]|uniref:BQ5605_C032g11048 protein n=1 Tax=Microbotryum silenes-dioicae TaxID=796604 RepID=A0A2X0PHJ3_9BASI|nr:BQ5605_C032g11048 [Microbotryum silenes-dioicae]
MFRPPSSQRQFTSRSMRGAIEPSRYCTLPPLAPPALKYHVRNNNQVKDGTTIYS